MKPSWENAPSWANYLAMDEDGQWTWYEKSPKEFHGRVWGSWEGRYEPCKIDSWHKTLESRPD
jgi:hypothetical protein